LRLPQSAQLVGLVQVEGRRGGQQGDDEESGLVASADREGFVNNDAFAQLQDLVRGAVEAVAYSDRRLQREQDESQRRALLASIRQETQSAIDEIEASSTIKPSEKARIVAAIVQTQQMAEMQDADARERERQLEIMSLLGVVAGFMTHEFGAALQELKDAQSQLRDLAKSAPQFGDVDRSLGRHVKNLTEFVTYSSGYIAGSKVIPVDPYPVLPRIKQMVRIFGQYAKERHIDIDLMIDGDLRAPLVPASLYNGIALNLYTNALKAVTARAGQGPRTIAFRAWNDRRWHFLEVSDTGVGIPNALRTRVFDPLFTTTDSRRDPLGSGMGLGLALVQRGVSAFGGRVDVVDPPPDFVTCVRVRLPLDRVTNGQ
jgi:signal transduction histidine kinase